jgi:hypothetical protein
MRMSSAMVRTVHRHHYAQEDALLPDGLDHPVGLLLAHLAQHVGAG